MACHLLIATLDKLFHYMVGMCNKADHHWEESCLLQLNPKAHALVYDSLWQHGWTHNLQWVGLFHQTVPMVSFVPFNSAKKVTVKLMVFDLWEGEVWHKIKLQSIYLCTTVRLSIHSTPFFDWWDSLSWWEMRRVLMILGINRCCNSGDMTLV